MLVQAPRAAPRAAAMSGANAYVDLEKADAAPGGASGEHKKAKKDAPAAEAPATPDAHGHGHEENTGPNWKGDVLQCCGAAARAAAAERAALRHAAPAAALFERRGARCSPGRSAKRGAAAGSGDPSRPPAVRREVAGRRIGARAAAGPWGGGLRAALGSAQPRRRQVGARQGGGPGLQAVRWARRRSTCRAWPRRGRSAAPRPAQLAVGPRLGAPGGCSARLADSGGRRARALKRPPLNLTSRTACVAGRACTHRPLLLVCCGLFFPPLRASGAQGVVQTRAETLGAPLRSPPRGHGGAVAPRGARTVEAHSASPLALIQAASTPTNGRPALALVRGGAARRAARLGWVTAAPVRAARRGAASGAWGTPSRRPDRADRTPRRRVRPSQVSGAAHEARCAPPGALAAVTSRHQLGAVRCSPPHSRDATAALGNRRDPSAVREVRRPRKSCAWCARLDTRARAGGVAFLTDARAAALWRPQRSREERCLLKMPT